MSCPGWAMAEDEVWEQLEKYPPLAVVVERLQPSLVAFSVKHIVLINNPEVLAFRSHYFESKFCTSVRISIAVFLIRDEAPKKKVRNPAMSPSSRVRREKERLNAF